MIIAIDGPAASGKGTLGKRLAHHYGYRHLDTGVIYRAVAKALLDAGADLTDEALAVAAAMELDPEKFGNPVLKSAGGRRGRLGGFGDPRVREALVDFQRHFAAGPPGAVLDGRDIGTVICPDADVKIFVVADPRVRARRRTLEAQGPRRGRRRGPGAGGYPQTRRTRPEPGHGAPQSRLRMLTCSITRSWI